MVLEYHWGPRLVAFKSETDFFAFPKVLVWLLDSITKSYLGSSNLYICDDMELPHTKGHTSNPWKKCPLREVFWQRVGKFPLKSIIALSLKKSQRVDYGHLKGHPSSNTQGQSQGHMVKTHTVIGQATHGNLGNTSCMSTPVVKTHLLQLQRGS